MKRSLFFLMLVSFLFTTSCYDDSFIREQLADHEKRISDLEAICLKINTNISSIQAVLDALQKNDYVTSMVPVTEAGKEIGYVLVFSSGKSVTIYHGKDGVDGTDGADGKDGADGTPGKDGVDGKDGYTPVIGVRKDADGVYYWTLDGKWLLDEDGNKIKAVGTDGRDGQDGADGKDGQDGQNGTDGKDGEDGLPGATGQDGKDGQDGEDGQDGKDGVTPQLKIEEDYWYVSYDNGLSWTRLGKATGEDGTNGTDGADGSDGSDGDSFFQSVSQDQDYVYLVLKDGTEILIPKAAGSQPVVADVVVSFDKVSLNTAVFKGEVKRKSVDMKVTVYYGKSSDLTLYNSLGNISVSAFSDASFTFSLTGLEWETEYFYFIETISDGVRNYSDVSSFTIGAEPYLRLYGGSAATSFYYSFDGADAQVAVLDANVDDFSVMIPEEATWIKEVYIDRNNVDGTVVVIYVTPNKDQEPRQTDVKVAYTLDPEKYVTFTVVQENFTGLPEYGLDNGSKYLVYHPNYYSYTTDVTINSANVYNYCSVINVSQTNSTRDKVECKFQFDKDLTSSSTSHYLCGNSSYNIFFNQTGMRFSYTGDSDSHLPGGTYSWSDLGVTSTLDPMVLIFESGNLTVNGNTIYDVPWDITGNYLFSSYYYDRDGGEYVDYDGIGDGTKLYYAKMWDSQGRLIYIGYPDKAVNPATGNMEYCWTSRSYSSSSGTVVSKNEFAYYNSALSEYVPYGGSF